jgi:hypothetical protein
MFRHQLQGPLRDWHSPHRSILRRKVTSKAADLFYANLSAIDT